MKESGGMVEYWIVWSDGINFRGDRHAHVHERMFCSCFFGFLEKRGNSEEQDPCLSHHPTPTKSYKGKVKVKPASTGQGYRGSYAFGGQPDTGCRVLTTNIMKQKKSPKQAVGTEERKREKIRILENMDIHISPIIFKYYVKNNTCT